MYNPAAQRVASSNHDFVGQSFRSVMLTLTSKLVGYMFLTVYPIKNLTRVRHKYILNHEWIACAHWKVDVPFPLIPIYLSLFAPIISFLAVGFPWHRCQFTAVTTDIIHISHIYHLRCWKIQHFHRAHSKQDEKLGGKARRETAGWNVTENMKMKMLTRKSKSKQLKKIGFPSILISYVERILLYNLDYVSPSVYVPPFYMICAAHTLAPTRQRKIHLLHCPQPTILIPLVPP